MTRERIVPVFIPHAGCPQQCSFCNQNAISHTQTPPSPDEVKSFLSRTAMQPGFSSRKAVVAFYGGSFTAIEPAYRLALLKAVQPLIHAGQYDGIRISTRPDCIDESILEELAFYHVDTVELGVQSMRDDVLIQNRRGHTAQDVLDASGLIRSRGFRLGHQMMTGLYGDDREGALYTAACIAAIKPDMIRIYPTLVLRNTLLEQLFFSGIWQPPEPGEVISLCSDLLMLFECREIPVIRLGLHDEPALAQAHVAGYHHPALREVCESAVMLRQAFRCLEQCGMQPGRVTLHVNPRDVSKMIGQHRTNLVTLAQHGFIAKVYSDVHLSPGMIEVTAG